MRLIDADALPAERVEWEDIINAPTVDIIRCCECKYLKQNRVTASFWCDRRADKVIVTPNDYCSFGERDEK